MLSVLAKRGYGWREGLLTFENDIGFKVVKVGGHVLVHVSGGSRANTLGLTKMEVARLMKGYPPFYHMAVVTLYGPGFEFPIHSPNDVRRGAWVVAVGMMKNEQRKASSLYCIPFQNDKEPDGWYDERKNGKVFRSAVARLGETLKSIRDRLTAQESVDLGKVIAAIDYMVATGTGSGVERHLPRRAVP